MLDEPMVTMNSRSLMPQVLIKKEPKTLFDIVE
jgi:hypothetical protein